MAKNKQIYLKLPTKKDDIFGVTLDYDALEEHCLIEKMVRPWVTRKVKEYLGVEEQALISLVIKHIRARFPPQALLDKLEPIIDVLAENFVIKLWQMLTFEHQKVV